RLGGFCGFPGGSLATCPEVVMMRSQEGSRLVAVLTIVAAIVSIDALSICAQDSTSSSGQPAVAGHPPLVAFPPPAAAATRQPQACLAPSGSSYPMPFFGGIGVQVYGQEIRAAVLPYNVAQQSLLNKVPSPIPNYENVFDRQRAAPFLNGTYFDRSSPTLATVVPLEWLRGQTGSEPPAGTFLLTPSGDARADIVFDSARLSKVP